MRDTKQLLENVQALENLNFSKEELKLIDKKAIDGGINIWAQSSSF